MVTPFDARNLRGARDRAQKLFADNPSNTFLRVVEPINLPAAEKSDISARAALGQAMPARGKGAFAKSLSGGISVIVSRPSPELPSRTNRSGGEANDATLALDKAEDIVAWAPEIRQQLTRILQSSVFIPSERLSRFLEFVVDHVIGGQQICLKEYVIGCEVYDRKPPYHPNQDSIVRTEARRLRGKLKEYYETEGKDDRLCVYLRPGSYVPIFRLKETLVGQQSAVENSDVSRSAQPSTTAIAILPFLDVSGTPLSSIYVRGLPDELAYTLMQTEGCRVISPAYMAHFITQGPDVAVAMSKVGAQIAYEASVREEGNHIRVTARIVDTGGFQLWTERFDARADAHAGFIIEEQIATAMAAAFRGLSGREKLLK